MSTAISTELFFFLKSILTGALIVFIYDIIRIFRRIIKHRTLAIALEDGLYWLASGFLIFMMMYEENDGIVRGFSIIGVALGMIVYNGSISKLVVKYTAFVINGVIHIVKKILYILSTPFRFILKKLGKGTNKISTKIGKGKKYFLKRLKNKLKEVKITLYKN